MKLALILGAAAGIALASPALAQEHHSRSDHSSRSDRDDSYWGRHVDAYRDHRYGDPTAHKFVEKPAYRSERDRDRDADDNDEDLPEDVD